ncbi:hypothetical protein KFU94_21870 [Chloroflexi bacterium TSY]|nr:hypothetical protein [Chloroflexi bacterium TSY]
MSNQQGSRTNIDGDVHTGGSVFNAGIINIRAAPFQASAAAAPKPPRDFVGRTEHLVELSRMLTGRQSAAIRALQGMGGIGKTALELTRWLKPEFSGRLLGGFGASSG